MKVLIISIISCSLAVCIRADCYRQNQCVSRGKNPIKYRAEQTWIPREDPCYNCECYEVKRYVVSDYALHLLERRATLLSFNNWRFESHSIESSRRPQSVTRTLPSYQTQGSILQPKNVSMDCVVIFKAGHNFSTISVVLSTVELESPIGRIETCSAKLRTLLDMTCLWRRDQTTALL